VNLYFIRHAEAAPLGTDGVNADEDRPLTPAGEEQTSQLAQALLRHGVTLSLLCSSPLLRARQTAHGLVHLWTDPKPEVRILEELIPDGKPRKLAKSLRRIQAESLALVGHMPSMAAFAAWFLGSKKAQVDFDKAGAAHFACADEIEKGCGTLLWLVTPEWCRG